MLIWGLFFEGGLAPLTRWEPIQVDLSDWIVVFRPFAFTHTERE